jgi:hypothetical protein
MYFVHMAHGNPQNRRTSVDGGIIAYLCLIIIQNNVMQDEGGQMVTLLSTTNAFGCEISWVVVRQHMPSEAFIHRNRFSHCVITNTVRFLFQCGFRTLGVVNDQHVVPVEIRRARQWHTHHAQFIP